MTYSWLVENFTKEGQSTGLYMACQVNMTLTADVHKARKFRLQRTAEFRALDMREAQRAYEANLNVIETNRAMQMRTLDLLKK